MSAEGSTKSTGSDWVSMTISIVNLVLTLAIIGAIIYLYVYVFKEITAIHTTQLEIKSKIGHLAATCPGSKGKTHTHIP